MELLVVRKQVQLLWSLFFWAVTRRMLAVSPTFRDNLSESPSRVKKSKNDAEQQVDGILRQLSP